MGHIVALQLIVKVDTLITVRFGIGIIMAILEISMFIYLTKTGKMVVQIIPLLVMRIILLIINIPTIFLNAPQIIPSLQAMAILELQKLNLSILEQKLLTNIPAIQIR